MYNFYTTELLAQDRQQRLMEERRQAALGTAVQHAKVRRSIWRWLARHLVAAPHADELRGAVRTI